VPTVGYVKPRVFAQSVFFDWGIGEPRGNGLLIVMSQGDATIQVVCSPVLQRFFSEQFLDVAVRNMLQPLLREGNASYAIVMMMHATAQYIDGMRAMWQENRIVPLHVENQLRFAERTFYYGMWYTSSFWTCVIGLMILTWLLNRILDMYCPECGSFMHRVRDEALLQKYMTRGQYLEHYNECSKYRVYKCPKPGCPGQRVRVYGRDIYQDSRCLPCHDCKYNTVTLEKTVLRLPTKTEDGVKQFMYTCENCMVARDIRLPLMRPLEEDPDDMWYANLLKRAANPMGEKTKHKLV